MHSCDNVVYGDITPPGRALASAKSQLAGNLGILWPFPWLASRCVQRHSIVKRHKGKMLSHTEGQGRTGFPSIPVFLRGEPDPC